MNLDVVIVTLNRLDKLKTALQHYERQTALFRNLIVVDNCSTDGTRQYLDEWARHPHQFTPHIIKLNSNTGGSGGFYAGQKYAMSLHPDWILLADDDAYPAKDAIELFYLYFAEIDCAKTAAICGSVLSMNGEPDLGHRRYVCLNDNGIYHQVFSAPEQYNKKCFDINVLSYVGAFINSKALLAVGLVNPRYFIYYDDSEHSLRLSKYGNIYCYPTIRFYHDNGWKSENMLKGEKNVLFWRDYYGKRNYYHMIKLHFFFYALRELFSYIVKSKSAFFRALIGTNKDDIYMLDFRARKDAWLNHLGINKIYKPGWKKNL